MGSIRKHFGSGYLVDGALVAPIQIARNIVLIVLAQTRVFC